MHVLPQLRRLEELFPRELVVIGVHSGKFHAERVTANIRQAVLRLEVRHPVVNDRYFRIWRSYGVQAWPTLVVIDPLGNHVGSHAGETTADALAPVIRRLTGQFGALGSLDARPPKFRPEAEREPERPLRFPGKVLARSDRLFIADSGHNRIVVVRLEPDGAGGSIERVIGNGEAALADGGFGECAFNHPQGMALAGDLLYVADTENHAVRAIDLGRGRVETLAGTGQQARRLEPVGRAREVALNSPWDLLLRRGILYVAMAGGHQIWVVDLASGEAGPHAGTGREDLADGPARQADLAQPTGLTSDGVRLYFADSESSAIRWADFATGGRVGTIVGTGLFDFGDRDGVGEQARLQHAYGLAWGEGRVYVADTYNNKIKVVDPATRSAVTLLGTGRPGHVDAGEPQFYEPEGVSVANGRLYIADTNNHVVRVADVRSGLVRTLRIDGL